MQAEASFEVWAASRQQALLRTAVLLTDDLERAEALVREALVRVALRWTRLAGGDPEGHARRFLYRETVSWWRRRLSRPTDVPAGLGEPDSGPGRRSALLDGLRRLPPRQRAVLVMRYFDGLTGAQCAMLLDVTAGAVDGAVDDALRRLRAGSPELADLLRDGF